MRFRFNMNMLHSSFYAAVGSGFGAWFVMQSDVSARSPRGRRSLEIGLICRIRSSIPPFCHLRVEERFV